MREAAFHPRRHVRLVGAGRPEQGRRHTFRYLTGTVMSGWNQVPSPAAFISFSSWRLLEGKLSESESLGASLPHGKGGCKSWGAATPPPALSMPNALIPFSFHLPTTLLRPVQSDSCHTSRKGQNWPMDGTGCICAMALCRGSCQGRSSGLREAPFGTASVLRPDGWLPRLRVLFRTSSRHALPLRSRSSGLFHFILLVLEAMQPSTCKCPTLG